MPHLLFGDFSPAINLPRPKSGMGCEHSNLWVCLQIGLNLHDQIQAYPEHDSIMDVYGCIREAV